VLDLSMTEESNSCLVRGSPELSLCEVKGIVKSYERVKLLCKILKISLEVKKRTLAVRQDITFSVQIWKLQETLL